MTDEILNDDVVVDDETTEGTEGEEMVAADEATEEVVEETPAAE
jgi:hypothetical protein